MNKPGPNAVWHELTDEQLKALEEWLFDERASQAEVLARARAQLGFQGSISSIRRFYLRRKKERVPQNLAQAAAEAATVNGSPADIGALRAANMKLVAASLLQALQEGPEKAPEAARYAALLMQNEYNEVLRESKAEEHKVRREAIAFAKERFHYDVMEKALKALPHLKELARARKDPETKKYEENALLNQLRREMFGVVWEVRPESAKEEEEMLAARREREAKKEQEAKSQQERERIGQPESPTPSSPYYQEYLQWKVKQEESDWQPGAEYEI